MNSVTIIGAGWSGLAAAVELAKNNIAVTVYESAKQIGGRARDIELEATTLDNGQHLIIGAYNQLLALLATTGTTEDSVFHRVNMQLSMVDFNNKKPVFELALPNLPAPLHLLVGMLQCRSLKFSDRLKTLWIFNKLLQQKISNDMPVSQWLSQSGLPENYCESLLKPLCLAALTTAPDHASARTFQTVLQQTFNGPRSNTDLLIAKTTLGKLFPQAAKRYIESKGGKVLTAHKVSNIDPKSKTLVVNETNEPYQHLIIATPAAVTLQLLQHHTQFSRTTRQLDLLMHEPVCTIYLQYPEQVKLPQPMLGCINSCSEWIFDRRYCNQPGLITVIISASGEHTNWTHDALIAKITDELAQLFPQWPAPLHTQVIREKRAAFQCHTAVDEIRPPINTTDSAIKLCGDYVYIEDNFQPGLPATLEGAVRCGVKCAALTLQELQS